MNWLIIRTDFRKEHFVARKIASLGFDAWVPCQLVAQRPHMARKALSQPKLIIRELPILPRRLFAAIPEPVGGDVLTIRHMTGIERDIALTPLRVAEAHILRFRAEIDRENTAALALATRPSRKQKARWRDMKDALLDMIDQAKQQIEAAA